MIKVYCDRCGAEIPNKKRSFLQHKVHYADLYFESIRNAGTMDYFDHALCEKCDDSFIRWFNHPEEDKVREGEDE